MAEEKPSIRTLWWRHRTQASARVDLRSGPQRPRALVASGWSVRRDVVDIWYVPYEPDAARVELVVRQGTSAAVGHAPMADPGAGSFQSTDLLALTTGARPLPADQVHIVYSRVVQALIVDVTGIPAGKTPDDYLGTICFTPDDGDGPRLVASVRLTILQ